MTEPSHAPSSGNFTNADSIKSSIVAALPLAFGKSELDDSSSFQERFASVSDFAAKVAKSPLSSETVRYQSLLLYLSLIFAAIRFFGLSAIEFKPFKTTLSVAWSLIYLFLY